MTLVQLRHLLALAESGSFSKSAQATCITQPAFSRSIRALEDELGMPLFDRIGRRSELTPFGRDAVQRARQLVFDNRCLERDIALYRSLELGDTAFGVGPFPAATFLAPLLASMRREFPAINLRVEISNWQLLLVRLREEDIEFFVADTRDLPTDSSLDLRPLRREPGGFYVRAGHPLARRKSVALQQLWTYGVLSVRVPQGVRSVMADLLGLPSAAELSLGVECDHVDLLKNVALGCDSVLAAPHEAVAQEVEAGRLHALEVMGLPPTAAEMGVVTLNGRTPSPMAKLIMGRLPGGEPA